MKPILLNTPMVQDVLDGIKTVARRPVKQPPKYCPGCRGEPQRITYDTAARNLYCGECGTPLVYFGRGRRKEYPAPYQPGDILYVRETWAKRHDRTGAENGFLYRADWGDEAEHPRWHPSIHMPKEAARIFLRVTEVWVEHLQDMMMSDMRNEGMIPPEVTGGQWQQWQRDYAKPLWNSTIKKADLDRYGWDANPWVFAIEFKRIEKEEL